MELRNPTPEELRSALIECAGFDVGPDKAAAVLHVARYWYEGGVGEAPWSVSWRQEVSFLGPNDILLDLIIKEPDA